MSTAAAATPRFPSFAATCLDLDTPYPIQIYPHWTTALESRRKPRSKFMNHSKAHYALLVPTYSKHSKVFCALLDSVVRNVAADPLQLVGVFSSYDDRRKILTDCNACNQPVTAGAKLELRSLIFRPPPRVITRRPDYFKFNFQATKKLWALAQMRAALVLVLDSDFLVTRPIHLKTMIDRYSGVLYETSTSLEAFDDRVVATTNELLGVRSDRFLMEPPWIFRPPLVRQLLQLILHRSLSGMLPSAGKLPPLPPQGSPKGSQLEETPQSAAQHSRICATTLSPCC